MYRILMTILLSAFAITQKTMAQNLVTTYSYDSSGNVIKREMAVMSGKLSKTAITKDTVAIAKIYYDGNSSVLTITTEPPYGTLPITVKIYNATTRLLFDTFSFCGPRYDHNLASYPNGIYIVEAICGDMISSKKISK